MRPACWSSSRTGERGASCVPVTDDWGDDSCLLIIAYCRTYVGLLAGGGEVPIGKPEGGPGGRITFLCCSGLRLVPAPLLFSLLKQIVQGNKLWRKWRIAAAGECVASVKQQIQVLNLKNLASPGRVVPMVNFLFSVLLIFLLIVFEIGNTLFNISSQWQ